MTKYNVLTDEAMNLSNLQGILCQIDNPTTYVKKFKDNLIYKNKQKGNFIISQNKKSFELHGKISKSLITKLREYGIKLKEIN